MQFVAVAALQQNVRNDAVLHHVRSAPLAGNYSVVSQVPPEIVSEILRPTIQLPLAKHDEAVLIHHKNSARSIAVWRSERAGIDSLGPAVYGMWRSVPRARRQCLRLDNLDNL